MHGQQNIKKRKLTTLKHRRELTACVLYQVPSSPFKTNAILISVRRRNKSHSWTVSFLNRLRFISVVNKTGSITWGWCYSVLVFHTFMALKSERPRTVTGWACTKTRTAIHTVSLVYGNVISVTRVLKLVIKFKLFASSNKAKLVITAEAKPKSPTTLDCSSNGIVGLNLVRSIRERPSVIK